MCGGLWVLHSSDGGGGVRGLVGRGLAVRLAKVALAWPTVLCALLVLVCLGRSVCMPERPTGPSHLPHLDSLVVVPAPPLAQSLLRSLGLVVAPVLPTGQSQSLLGSLGLVVAPVLPTGRSQSLLGSSGLVVAPALPIVQSLLSSGLGLSLEMWGLAVASLPGWL